MATKKSQSPSLSQPEKLLFAIAVRLNTAIQYLADNPGGNNSWFISGITAEMKEIAAIYAQYPQDGGVRHRVHGVIGVVAKEWKIAEEENRSPDVGKLSVKAVDKCCANTVKHYPQWPSVLHSTDLSEYVEEQPQEKLWWELPGSPMDMSAEDSGDGLRRSGRINKGKAPAPPDVEPVPALQQRGKKRSAVESTGDSDKTARRAVVPPSRRVVVKSPPEARRPKQRLRIGEDGQAAEPVLSEEQDTGAPEGVWVGRGEDRCNECKQSNETLCVPQWGATKPSKACTYCAGRKRSCHPTKEWLRQVDKLRPDRVGQRKAPGQAPPAVQGTDAADTGIATRRRRAPKKQPSPQAVANQDVRMAALEESVQELTESHKKLMGTQKQLISMMLAVCSRLGIKVTMPDDSTAFAVVRSTVSSIPSPLVDDVSALSIGRAPASAAPSVASASSARSSMRSGTSAFRARPLSTAGGGSHHGSAAVSRASSRERSYQRTPVYQAAYGISEQSPNGIVRITWDRTHVHRSKAIVTNPPTTPAKTRPWGMTKQELWHMTRERIDEDSPDEGEEEEVRRMIADWVSDEDDNAYVGRLVVT
ncbi:hypothetical protein BJY52DRAFT_1229420 [Lactarius psammicola]|nr:hypothetical protein BJY52DRAFT_1229420 [Lactarius psammicola]